jgi:hypothetical protein
MIYIAAHAASGGNLKRPTQRIRDGGSAAAAPVVI